MKTIAKLTDLEIKIMRVLWEHRQSMTIQEIAGSLKEERISVASVTQAMQKLVKKKAVEVSGQVLVSSVYARTFEPCFTQEECLAAELKRVQKNVLGLKKPNVMGIAVSLLENDVNDDSVEMKDLEELLRIIKNRKEKLM